MLNHDIFDNNEFKALRYSEDSTMIEQTGKYTDYPDISNSKIK